VESLGVYAVGARVQCAVGEQVRAEGGQGSGSGPGHAHQPISLLQRRGLSTPLHALTHIQAARGHSMTCKCWGRWGPVAGGEWVGYLWSVCRPVEALRRHVVHQQHRATQPSLRHELRRWPRVPSRQKHVCLAMTPSNKVTIRDRRVTGTPVLGSCCLSTGMCT
jgi:hypothetical protein